ncbi:hypothetical protein AVEN_121651-1 [Araneus ventricosus]|uniref:Uncharacterized protein n=1 Tax=Araneus ventricosus TaxID=182803 RepID=A0A4Y2KW12_ARAVE|nr:hypothetical protein AVEN_121651-1 [Araneus ventricosus]
MTSCFRCEILLCGKDNSSDLCWDLVKLYVILQSEHLEPNVLFQQDCTTLLDMSYVEPMEWETCSCEEAMDWQPIDSVEEMEWEEVPLPPQVSAPLPLKTGEVNGPNKPTSVRRVKRACLRL